MEDSEPQPVWKGIQPAPLGIIGMPRRTPQANSPALPTIEHMERITARSTSSSTSVRSKGTPELKLRLDCPGSMPPLACGCRAGSVQRPALGAEDDAHQPDRGRPDGSGAVHDSGAREPEMLRAGNAAAAAARASAQRWDRRFSGRMGLSHLRPPDFIASPFCSGFLPARRSERAAQPIPAPLASSL